MGVFGLDVASQMQKKKDAEAANALKYRQSTVMPKIPKALKRQYQQKLHEKNQHFLNPTQRANIFARMQRGAELRGKQNDAAIAARTGGDTSSLGYQYLQTLNNQGLAAETASQISDVDIQDLYKGEEKRRVDLDAIFKLMNLSTGSVSTAPPTPVPGIDWAGALNRSVSMGMGIAGGMAGGGGMGSTGV